MGSIVQQNLSDEQGGTALNKELVPETHFLQNNENDFEHRAVNHKASEPKDFQDTYQGSKFKHENRTENDEKPAVYDSEQRMATGDNAAIENSNEILSIYKPIM